MDLSEIMNKLKWPASSLLAITSLRWNYLPNILLKMSQISETYLVAGCSLYPQISNSSF